MQNILGNWRKKFLLSEAVLRHGMRCKVPCTISQIQQKLVDGKYMPAVLPNGKSSVDGDYGSATVVAVKKFQEKAFPNNPEEWDGIVSDDTGGKMGISLSNIKDIDRRTSRSSKKTIDDKKTKLKKAEYWKGKKRAKLKYKGKTSSLMTPLKSIAAGILGRSFPSQGKEVEALKIWLVDKGFFGKDLKDKLQAMFDIDGTFILDSYDDATEKAVKNYQKHLGLKITGTITQETALPMILNRIHKKAPPTIRSSEEEPKAKDLDQFLISKFGPSKKATRMQIKNIEDAVNRNYTMVLKKAVSNRDPIFQRMTANFIQKAEVGHGTKKEAAIFYYVFYGLARATIQKYGYGAWALKFNDFALDPAVREIWSSDFDNAKAKELIQKQFGLSILNAQTFAVHMKSSEDFNKKEKKVISFLNSPNSYLAFNLNKTRLQWVLACGRKQGSSKDGKCKALDKRNINDLNDMIDPRDLIMKEWRGTSGNLELYKQIKGTIDSGIQNVKDFTFPLADKQHHGWVRRIENAFRQLGSIQNRELRRASNLGPLPVGVYRVSDFQEKHREDFEEHFSRNISKKISQQMKDIFPNREEAKNYFKLLKKFKFIPTRSRDVKTTYSASGKPYRGKRPISWNVSNVVASAAGAWGAQRMWLEKLNIPDKKASKRFGFSIHGGAAFGSSGCLDLGAAMGDFSKFYRKAVGDADILLVSVVGRLPSKRAKKYYLGVEKGEQIEDATV